MTRLDSLRDLPTTAMPVPDVLLDALAEIAHLQGHDVNDLITRALLSAVRRWRDEYSTAAAVASRAVDVVGAALIVHAIDDQEADEPPNNPQPDVTPTQEDYVPWPPPTPSPSDDEDDKPSPTTNGTSTTGPSPSPEPSNTAAPITETPPRRGNGQPESPSQPTPSTEPDVEPTTTGPSTTSRTPSPTTTPASSGPSESPPAESSPPDHDDAADRSADALGLIDDLYTSGMPITDIADHLDRAATTVYQWRSSTLARVTDDDLATLRVLKADLPADPEPGTTAGRGGCTATGGDCHTKALPGGALFCALHSSLLSHVGRKLTGKDTYERAREMVQSGDVPVHLTRGWRP